MSSDPDVPLSVLTGDEDLRSDGVSYHVVGRLSRGGMGDILLAERRSLFATELVVLKRLSPDLDQAPYVAMFMTEARVMARLRHPNVVRLLDTPIVDGAHCLALELVRGTNLYQLYKRARMEGDPLPLDVALYVGLETLAGLAYTHSAEVDGRPLELVHRDVKPGNVLVSFDGDVKLTDFGIAKSILSMQTTSQGVVKGTPHYLAPEQIRGGRASRRSDIFSLAVVLVEAATGLRLHKRDTLAGTLFAVTSGERPPIDHLLPAPLLSVLDRALSLDPADRYATAEEMAEALRAAHPIDESAARATLAHRVQSRFESAAPALAAPETKRIHRTGAFPLEPNQFEIPAKTRRVPTPKAVLPPEPTELERLPVPRVWPWLLLALAAVSAAGLAVRGLFW